MAKVGSSFSPLRPVRIIIYYPKTGPKQKKFSDSVHEPLGLGFRTMITISIMIIIAHYHCNSYHYFYYYDLGLTANLNSSSCSACSAPVNCRSQKMAASETFAFQRTAWCLLWALPGFGS